MTLTPVVIVFDEFMFNVLILSWMPPPMIPIRHAASADFCSFLGLVEGNWDALPRASNNLHLVVLG